MGEPSGNFKKPLPTLVFFLTGIVFSGLGIYHADKLKWYSDNAFIFLRYVQNWTAGHGLVYNPGERIEGYSCFLWALITKLGQFLKLDSPEWIIKVGLICFLCLMAMYIYNSYRLKSPLPLTVIALALHYDFKVWATGGLETMLFTLLLSAVFTVFILLHKFPLTARLAVTGVLLSLLMLTRPDGVLFYFCAEIFLIAYLTHIKPCLWTGIKYFLVLNAPVMVIGIPFLIWKLDFYGDILPNTFYLKTGVNSNIAHGFYYLYSYFASYPSSLFCFIGTPIVLLIYRHGKTRTQRLLFYIVNDKEFVVLLSLMAMTLVYIFGFILKMGGDCMFARYMAPIIPFFYFSVELVLIILIRNFKSFERKRGFIFSIAAISFILLSPIEKELRNRILFDDSGKIKELKIWHGITDERLLCAKNYDFKKIKEMGSELKPYFSGLNVKVLSIRDAGLSYYADFSYVLDYFGRTDKMIARKVQENNSSKKEHRKHASYEYIMEKGIDFCFNHKMFINEEHRKVRFETKNYQQRAEMFFYNKALIRELEKRFGDKFQYVDLENYFNQFISGNMKTMDKDQVRKIYMKYKEYYFSPNNDDTTKDQENQILEYINET